LRGRTDAAAGSAPWASAQRRSNKSTLPLGSSEGRVKRAVLTRGVAVHRNMWRYAARSTSFSDEVSIIITASEEAGNEHARLTRMKELRAVK
jgi:hypothetical protein